MSGRSSKQLHQLVLALGIEGRCCLVEHDDVRLVQQNARECQALLFAARERLIPRRVLVELLDEMLEADASERFRNVFDASAFRRIRIGCRAAQCADRHIRTLRQEEDLGALS